LDVVARVVICWANGRIMGEPVGIVGGLIDGSGPQQLGPNRISFLARN